MSHLTHVFAGVSWMWVLKWSAVMACVSLMVQRWRGLKPMRLDGLAGGLLPCAAWMVYLILSHSSSVLIEINLSFSLGLVIEYLVCLVWNGRTWRGKTLGVVDGKY